MCVGTTVGNLIIYYTLFFPIKKLPLNTTAYIS